MNDSKVKNLIKILENSEIDELEISTFWGKNNIKLKKSPSYSSSIDSEYTKKESLNSEIHDNTIVNNEIISHNEEVNKEVAEPNLDKENLLQIKAPLVGTFYSSPNPDSEPFVKIGDNIKAGKIICIVEAMKIFNEIESEISGKVIEILVKDGTPVEFDQPLLLISPD